MPVDFIEESAVDFQEESAPSIDFQPAPKSEKYLAMQKERDVLQAEGLADEIVTKIIEGTEGVISKIAAPVTSVLELPEQLARIAGVQNPPSAQVPAVNQEAALKAVEFVTPGGAASEGTTGQAVQELAAEFISGATTPAMVGGLLAGTKAPVAIGRVFQAEMLGHVPASVVAVAQAEPGQAKTKAALELGVNVALPALIEKGISKPAAKEILVERAAEVGPATEAVVKNKEALETPPERSVPTEAAPVELVKPVEVAQPISTEPPLPVITTEKPVSQGAPVERITELRAPKSDATFKTHLAGVFPDEVAAAKALETSPHFQNAYIREENGRFVLYEDRPTTQPEPIGMGAATPAEYAMPKGSPTGIKNATLDAERAKRDLPPAMEAGRQSFGEAWDRAMARIDKDPSTGTRPGYQDRLIAELADKPRAVTDIEDATLLHRQIDLHHEYNRAIEAVKQAADDGRMEDLALEQVRLSEISDRVHELYTINQAVGTETGRGLAARKMMAYEDFSLAKMEVERRAAKGGEQLTPEERDEVVTLQKKIEETQKRYDDYVAKSQQQITALEMKAALAATTKTAQETISPKIKAIAERIVNNLEREADAAWKRIQERGLTFGSGPLHELPNIKDFAIIGASKAVKSGVDFAQWSASMARQFGEGIKPHLERIWDESQKMLNSLEEMRPMAQETPKRRKPNKEETKLSFEAVQAKKEWQQKLVQERRAQRTTVAKVFDETSEAVNMARVLMTTGEFSAVLKQGGFTGIGNPFRAAKAIPAMMEALRSEQGMHKVNMEIASRPNYPLYVRSKLFLAEHGHSLSKMEEAYMSRWADKIPVLRGFQRSHPTFLNKLRADSFDAMAATLVRRKQELTPERARLLSDFINMSTGRATFGKLERSNTATEIFARMNQLFFAPRWVASRFQLAAGVPIWRALKAKDLPMARLFAEEYAKFLTGLGVIYGLWTMAGGEIGTDRKKTDFGKLKVGDTDVDLMAGLQQGTVLMSRLQTGEKTTVKGKTVPIRGEKVPFGGDNSASVIGNFLRTKLAPVPASGLDLLTGKDITGKPVDLASEMQELSIPLTYRDIYKAMREHGTPADVALSLLALFGAGVQTRDK